MIIKAKKDVINKKQPEIETIELVAKNNLKKGRTEYVEVKKKVPNYDLKKGEDVGLISKHEGIDGEFYTVINSKNKIFLCDASNFWPHMEFKNNTLTYSTTILKYKDFEPTLEDLLGL